jgi:hypothetical protein
MAKSKREDYFLTVNGITVEKKRDAEKKKGGDGRKG